MRLFEILVPTIRNSGKPIRTRMHREWDRRVRFITGGLTVLAPAKGQWVAGCGTLFNERMIPVRVMCTEEQMEQVVDLTIQFYDQLAVMYYELSNNVRIKHAPSYAG